jgi:hypothetical protein
MNRDLALAGLIAGLFLAAGCRHAAPDPDLPGGQTPLSFRARPAPDGRATTLPPPPPAAPPSATASVVPVRRDAPAAPARATITAIDFRNVPPPPATPARLERPIAGGVAARGNVLATGFSGYAHAADYGWLVGCLIHDREHDRWLVRYADPGSPDRHDGTLELLGAGPMAGFWPGQLVRVEGELVDPDPLQIKPAYRVRSLQVLRR